MFTTLLCVLEATMRGPGSSRVRLKPDSRYHVFPTSTGPRRDPHTAISSCGVSRRLMGTQSRYARRSPPTSPPAFRNGGRRARYRDRPRVSLLPRGSGCRDRAAGGARDGVCLWHPAAGVPLPSSEPADQRLGAGHGRGRGGGGERLAYHGTLCARAEAACPGRGAACGRWRELVAAYDREIEIGRWPHREIALRVESIDTSAKRAASSSDTSGRMMRSRMGVPHLLSPSCRYGVSGELAMQLPSG